MKFGFRLISRLQYSLDKMQKLAIVKGRGQHTCTNFGGEILLYKMSKFKYC